MCRCVTIINVVHILYSCTQFIQVDVEMTCMQANFEGRDLLISEFLSNFPLDHEL